MAGNIDTTTQTFADSSFFPYPPMAVWRKSRKSAKPSPSRLSNSAVYLDKGKLLCSLVRDAADGASFGPLKGVAAILVTVIDTIEVCSALV